MTLLAVHVLGAGSLAPGQPAIFADDEGFLRGRAVFETVRVYDGRPFRLAAHLQRLAHSAAAVGLPEPDLDGLARACAAAVAEAGVPDATLRFLWTPGREGLREPTGLTLVSTLPPDLEQRRERGFRLAVVGWAPGHRLAATKSTSYAENLAAQAEAQERGADDALLVTVDGTVLEAPTANVWFREGRRLLTPALAQPILAGVTRAAVWELAAAAGYEVEEGVFPLARAAGADEVFLSSSIRELMPVVALDSAAIGDGAPGDAARQLQRALRRLATSG